MRISVCGIIDASIDNSDGWPELITEPGAYYQSFTSGFGVLVTYDVDPGRYRLASAALTCVAVGTCPHDQG